MKAITGVAGRALEPGAIFEIPYPFKREEYEDFDEEGRVAVATWNPGIVYEQVTPDGCTDGFADAMGAAIYEVVTVHKPGAFPTRVFYLRRWRTPDGKEFGKRKLRCATLGTFRGLLKGYRHPFTLEPAEVRRRRERSEAEEACRTLELILGRSPADAAL